MEGRQSEIKIDVKGEVRHRERETGRSAECRSWRMGNLGVKFGNGERGGESLSYSVGVLLGLLR